MTSQKKVNFNTQVKSRFIEHVPREARPNLWYLASDYSEARERERFVECCLQQCDHSEMGDNLIAEGIFTIEQRAINDITIDNSISAVLDEQERQEAEYDLDENDASLFVLDENAQEYRVHSRVSLAQAQNRARRHAQHVRDFESQPKEVHSPPPPSRSPKPTKTKMSLADQPAQYGREVLRREDAPQVVKCTTPAA